MKTRTKVALTGLCALLLVAASVLGTLAYLTAEQTVTNTFTVGNVAITLTETEVDEYGKAKNDPATRTSNEQTFKIIPGTTYTKDPTITVADNSEECYLFVKVANGISTIETSIASQLAEKGWSLVNGETDVYYLNTTKKENEEAVVFETITIDSTVDNLTQYAGKQIAITAYAVQKDNFATAQAAWDGTFGA